MVSGLQAGWQQSGYWTKLNGQFIGRLGQVVGRCSRTKKQELLVLHKMAQPCSWLQNTTSARVPLLTHRQAHCILHHTLQRLRMRMCDIHLELQLHAQRPHKQHRANSGMACTPTRYTSLAGPAINTGDPKQLQTQITGTT